MPQTAVAVAAVRRGAGTMSPEAEHLTDEEIRAVSRSVTGGTSNSVELRDGRKLSSLAGIPRDPPAWGKREVAI